MGAGGRLYIVSAYAVVLVILVLRIGPRVAGIISDDGSSAWYDTDGWDTESEYNLATSPKTTVSCSGKSRVTNKIKIQNDDGKSNNGLASREEQRWLLEHEHDTGLASIDSIAGKIERRHTTTLSEDIYSEKIHSIDRSLGMEPNDIASLGCKLTRINRISSHPGFTAEARLHPPPRPALRKIQSDTEFIVPVRIVSNSEKKKYPHSRNRFSGIILKD